MEYYIETNNMEKRDRAAALEAFLSEFTWPGENKKKPEPLLLYEGELERLVNIEKAGDSFYPRLIVVRGERGSGRKLLLRHLFYRCNIRVLWTEYSLLLKKYEEHGALLVKMLEEKIRTGGYRLCICGKEGAEDDALWEGLLEGLARAGISCFITSAEPGPGLGGFKWELAEFVLASPGTEERIRLWEYFLSFYPREQTIEAALLAEQYNLNGGSIKALLRTAGLYRDGQGREVLAEEDIAEAASVYRQDSMGNLARKLPCVFKWEDLVIDDRARGQLEILLNQVKYRYVVGSQWGFYERRPYGNGVCALFYGPPGTGKTMAAQVIAGELGMELYRVDLSQLSSKYIGETQKNISQIFDQARKRNVILFFDEADAVFARRTEIKDANDRHGNSETAHLLQRLEEYEGMTILATNLKNQLDDAFKRRMKMVIHFRLPDRKAREELWEKAFPQKAPLDKGVNLKFFAEKFEISGSEIREIALDAAFMAASGEGSITRNHICQAMVLCFEKYGRVLLESDFEEV